MDYLNQDIASVIDFPRSFRKRIVSHHDFSRLDSITKSYITIAGTTISGIAGIGNFTLATTTDLRLAVPVGAIIQISEGANTDLYTVSAVGVATITTVEALVNTYVTAAIALDRLQINDIGPRGLNLSNATTTTRPVYIPSGIGGLPCASFINSALNTLTSEQFATSRNMTAFLVMRNDLNASLDRLMWSVNGGFRWGIAVRETNTTFYGIISADGSARAFPATTSPSLGTPALCGLLVRNDLTTFDNMDTLATTTTAPMVDHNVSESMLLGVATSGCGTTIGEALWIDGALSPYEYNHIKEKLKRKWGLY